MVGLVVVFSALGAIWLLMELMGALFRAADARRARPLPAAPLPSTATATAGDLRPELIAVITAAVHSSIDSAATIVAITPVAAHQETNLNLLAWSSEGRRQIFASHKLR